MDIKAMEMDRWTRTA